MLELPLEPAWSILLALTGFIYLAGLGWINGGLGRLKSSGADVTGTEWTPAVSVIIPCRNEVRHIGAALENLAAQDYPHERFEVIVVDDRSADGTGEADTGKVPGLKVVDVRSPSESLSPKKNALLHGLREAGGEVIITTDGDCRFQSGWIRSLVSGFDDKTGVVTGLTVFDRGRPEPFWQRMQQLDYLSHSFFAAGAIGGGIAFNCNGSNLALRREAFEEAGGYGDISHVVTGDDTLLVQRIRRQGCWRIRFSTDPQSLVRSWPEETPAQVFNQRLRWGSGGLSYTAPALAFALATFGFFLALLLSPILWLNGLVNWLWIAFFLTKVLQEFKILKRGWVLFGLKPDWPAALALELIHIPAIITFSIGGHLLGFRWKGQRFKRTKVPVLSDERMTK